jgi:hypothetical protein
MVTRRAEHPFLDGPTQCLVWSGCGFTELFESYGSADGLGGHDHDDSDGESGKR